MSINCLQSLIKLVMRKFTFGLHSENMAHMKCDYLVNHINHYFLLVITICDLDFAG